MCRYPNIVESARRRENPGRGPDLGTPIGGRQESGRQENAGLAQSAMKQTSRNISLLIGNKSDKARARGADGSVGIHRKERWLERLLMLT